MKTFATLAMHPLSVLPAFGLTPASNSEPATTPVRDAASVQTLIGDAACEGDTQCATIGVGAKACGGPEGYVAWSITRTDSHALRTAAKDEADAARRERDKSSQGMVSNCSSLDDPGAFCDLSRAASGRTAPSGTCRTRNARGFASPLAR